MSLFVIPDLIRNPFLKTGAMEMTTWGISIISNKILAKKLAAFFVLSTLLVNSFAPSAAQINKYSLVLVMGAVAHNVTMQLLSKSRDVWQLMTVKICLSLSSLLRHSNEDVLLPKDAAGQKQEPNNAQTPLPIKEVALTESRRQIAAPQLNQISSVVFTKELFKLYCNLKIPCDAVSAPVVLLLALVFILTIKKRKIPEMIKSFQGFVFVTGTVPAGLSPISQKVKHIRVVTGANMFDFFTLKINKSGRTL